MRLVITLVITLINMLHIVCIDFAIHSTTSQQQTHTESKIKIGKYKQSGNLQNSLKETLHSLLTELLVDIYSVLIEMQL